MLVNMDQLVLLICLVIIACAHPHHTGCRFWHIVQLLSDRVHFQLLHPSPGTACLLIFNYSYVASYYYVRQTKWTVCVISVWAHYSIVIERLIDRSLDV